MLVKVKAKLNDCEKEELNDMWKGVFGVELKGLEAKLAKQKTDQKQ